MVRDMELLTEKHWNIDPTELLRPRAINSLIIKNKLLVFDVVKQGTQTQIGHLWAGSGPRARGLRPLY